MTTVRMCPSHFTWVILIIAIRNAPISYHMFSNTHLKCCARQFKWNIIPECCSCLHSCWSVELFCISADFFFLVTWKRWNYFKDYSNQSDWCTAILSFLFVIPIMLNVDGSWHWQAGAMAILNSWIGFLFYLQRYCLLWLNSAISTSCLFLWCRGH